MVKQHLATNFTFKLKKCFLSDFLNKSGFVILNYLQTQTISSVYDENSPTSCSRADSFKTTRINNLNKHIMAALAPASK